MQDSIAPVSASIKPGKKKHLMLSLPSTKIIYLNISTDIDGAGNLVYASCITQNPNPAFYDFEFHLHKVIFLLSCILFFFHNTTLKESLFLH